MILSKEEKKIIEILRSLRENLGETYYETERERLVAVDGNYCEGEPYVYFDFENVIKLDEALEFFKDNYLYEQDEEEDSEKLKAFTEWLEDPYFRFKSERVNCELIHMEDIPIQEIRLLKPSSGKFHITNNIDSLDPHFRSILRLLREEKRRENEK